MKKRSVKIMSAMLAALLLVLSLAACSTAAPAVTSAPAATTAASAVASATAQATDAPTESAFAKLKLDGITLKFWHPLLWTGKATDKDNVVWQEIQKRLGINLTFITPTTGQEQDQFNLMVAGNDLPDIISTGWSGDDLYTGGLDKYIQDGVLIKLNDLIPVYAPDYLNIIKTKVEPAQQKEFYTDSGNMVEFYAISPYEEYCYNGLQYRQDWMDKLGLQNPKTLADVEAALTAFKTTMGAKSPMILTQSGIDNLGGTFVSAFNIGPAFYQKDNKVMYGPAQPGFKSYLVLMNDWYKKGLIDQDFSSRDEDAWKRMITTGESGAIIHSPDTVGAWMNGITTMMGGYNPVQNAGDTINFRLKTFQCRPPYAVAVTTACKTPEAAVKFLDYGYTETGWMLYNYGIEGQTYNLVDGKAVYTDMMLKNPDFPVLDAILKFKVHIGPFLRFEHEGNPAINQSTMAIRKFWTESAGTSLDMPMVTLTADEGTEYARIMTQVNTYVTTGTLKFIMGTDPLDNFPAFVDGLKKLEIDKAVALEQAALDRYNKR